MKKLPIILLSKKNSALIELPDDPYMLLGEVSKIYTRTNTNIYSIEKIQPKEIIDIQSRLFERDGMRIAIEDILSIGENDIVGYSSDGCDCGLDNFAASLLRDSSSRGLASRVYNGDSYIDELLRQLDFENSVNPAIFDSLQLANSHVPPFPPTMTGVIIGAYSQKSVEYIKANLETNYPKNHMLHILGKQDDDTWLGKDILLDDLDRDWQESYTTIVVPILSPDCSFEAFQELVAHLRAPEGCPWDREQTHASLRANLLEETYEVLAALDQSNWVGLREEMGDLLLQILLHTQIACESDEFRMPQVIHTIHRKLVRRHPHVFGEVQVDNVAGILRNWEDIKANERKMNGESHKGLLDGVPITYPALAQAQDIQARAARVGFDWSDIAPVLEKVHEELTELQQAETDQRRAEELGDLLFAVVNVSRWLGVEAESALRQTNDRFRQRFRYVEQKAKEAGRNLKDMTLDEMDVFWEEAKGIMGQS